MANYYHSEIGGKKFYKQIAPDVYMCITGYSDSYYPDITFEDDLPISFREISERVFNLAYNAALAKIKEAKNE